MTDVPMTQAGIAAPVLVFPSDDDVFPFEGVDQLFAKTGWWHSENRHLDLEVVDNGGRRWIVTGTMAGLPEKRRWWQLRRPAGAGREIAVRPLEPEGFDETRARVEGQAARLFDEGDATLTEIRAARSMAELSSACYQITVRAQGRRILAGDATVPVRTAREVADRVLVLFALCRLAFGADRREVMEWLDENDLIEALTPGEAPLLTTRHLSDEQRAEAGWNIEEQSALLWAVGFADMPSPAEHPDMSTLAALLGPNAALGVAQFRAACRLRPLLELAEMAETCGRDLGDAERRDEAAPSDNSAMTAEALTRRYGAIQWILNPARLEWR